MSTQILSVLASAVLIALCTVSCTKKVQKVYPSEVTLDNYEEFIDAPQSVIDALVAKEQANRVTSNKEVKGDATFIPKCFAGPNPGRVTAWNGSEWVGLPNVQITKGNSSGITSPDGKYAVCNSTPGAVCMEYTTHELNGINGIDIIQIKRHILGIRPFGDTPDGIRRYIAADVNHDGTIDDDDVTAIKKVILVIDSLPGNNITFVPIIDMDFYVVTDSWGLGFLQNNCRNDASHHMSRRAIKMGDVSGNWSF